MRKINRESIWKLRTRLFLEHEREKIVVDGSGNFSISHSGSGLASNLMSHLEQECQFHNLIHFYLVYFVYYKTILINANQLTNQQFLIVFQSVSQIISKTSHGYWPPSIILFISSTFLSGYPKPEFEFEPVDMLFFYFVEPLSNILILEDYKSLEDSFFTLSTGV